MNIDEFLNIKQIAKFTNVKLAKYLGVTDVQVRNYIAGRRDILRRTKNQMLLLDVLYKIRASVKNKSIRQMIDDVLKETTE